MIDPRSSAHKDFKENAHLNGMEGMALKKGAQIPPTTVNTLKNPQTEVLKA